MSKVAEYVKEVVDRTADFVKDNKVEIATTVATGGAGAIKGAVKKQD